MTELSSPIISSEEFWHRTKPFADISVAAIRADEAACGHYRIVYPIEFLRRGGADAIVLNQFRVEDIIKREVVLVQRQYDPELFRLLMDLRTYGKIILYELDDNLHAVHPNSTAYQTYRPGSEALRSVEKYLRNVDGFICSTPELAGEYQMYARRTWVIPNYIDFGIRDWESPVARHPDLVGKLVVGWIGGITHQDDWQPLYGWLREFLLKHDEVVFAIASAYRIMDLFCSELDLPKEKVVRLDPVDFEKYPALVAQIDVGLAPLVNTPFNQAKCLSVKTRVATDRGIVPIGEVSEGDRIWNGKTWVRVLATERQLSQSGLRIVTRNGYRLDLTRNHRIMTDSGWKRADEVTVGTRVTMSCFQTLGADCSDPTSGISTDLATLAGFILGRGASCRGSLGIRLYGCDPGLRQYVIELLRRVCPEVRTVEDGFGRLLIGQGQPIVQALLDRGFVRRGLIPDSICPADRVPECIWRAPLPVVAAFLRGYVSATCGISPGSLLVADADARSGLVEDIQQLLLAFGIVSDREGKSVLLLHGPSTTEFATKIGFMAHSLYDQVMHGLCLASSAPGVEEIDTGSWWDTVAEVVPIQVDPIDIQVEGEVFVAAGYVSHNSALKLLEYGARGIPYVATKISPYIRFHLETEGQGGYLAYGAGEWYEALEKLVSDETDRKSRGEFLRNYVRNYCGYDSNVYRWADAIREARVLAREPSDIARRVVPWAGRVKFDRNGRCPCGSGRKYKKCCYPAWG